MNNIFWYQVFDILHLSNEQHNMKLLLILWIYNVNALGYKYDSYIIVLL